MMAMKTLTAQLGKYQPLVDSAKKDLKENHILPRIWNLDYQVWRPDPDEITNRLGWLRIANTMKTKIPQMEALADRLKSEGYTDTILLGMGGSSLAPEVFRKTFGVKDGYPDLAVLDSTDPGAVAVQRQRLDLSKTLFIVSTKSGGTEETLSFFKYFFNQVVEELGEAKAGAHFVAITDSGSRLETLAHKFNFREIFLNDPNIGGRYSALSYFGLVPATLVGVNVTKLLDRAISMATREELGAELGAILGVLAMEGRDKVTFVASKRLESFGDWVEQLIAESTGKDGKGILPVVHELPGPPEAYGNDRLFVHQVLRDEIVYQVALDTLSDSGHPVISLFLEDLYDLGGQIFLWEMAIAVAGYFLRINPFDQPNVESAKVLARKMVAAFIDTGTLPKVESAPLSPIELDHFLANTKPGDYIALQAFIQPTPDATTLLQSLRLNLRDRYHLATTLGYGPRFLHSTGQLHKGDGGNGLFIQFTSDPDEDIPIPDEAGKPQSNITFGTLKMAQALGDGQALLDAKRRFIRFHLGPDLEGLGGLT
jgi:transaldolase/glucose-6-phosphate isomerase